MCGVDSIKYLELDKLPKNFYMQSFNHKIKEEIQQFNRTMSSIYLK